ncbi:hypothetical protein D3C75_461070 [compost metagenome]
MSIEEFRSEEGYKPDAGTSLNSQSIRRCQVRALMVANLSANLLPVRTQYAYQLSVPVCVPKREQSDVTPLAQLSGVRRSFLVWRAR